MNELLAQYRAAQAAYIATLEPWLAAQEAKRVAAQHYRKMIKEYGGPCPKRSTSHKQHNKSRDKWLSRRSIIDRAALEYRAAEKVWKEAKAVRWSALCVEYTLRMKLQPARQLMREEHRKAPLVP
jgi:hypothetical protein